MGAAGLQDGIQGCSYIPLWVWMLWGSGRGGVLQGGELHPHASQPGVELFFTVEFL